MNEDNLGNEVAAIVTEAAEQPAEKVAAQLAATEDPRLHELERRVRDLETALGDLRSVSAQSAAASEAVGRRTQGAHAPRLLAKGGEPVQPAAVDAALGSLSVEQRFAVKAGLLRAGLL